MAKIHKADCLCSVCQFINSSDYKVKCDMCLDTKQVQTECEDNRELVVIPCPDCCKDYYQKPNKME